MTYPRFTHCAAQAIRRALLISLSLTVSLPLFATPSPPELEKLRAHRYLTTPTQIASEGLSFTRDTATWTFRSGSFQIQEPVEGTVTGLVFEGQGEFHMTVPDPVELRHLRRQTGEAELEAFEVSFTRLVIRTSEPEAFSWLGTGATPQDSVSFSENQLAKKRHDHWMKDRFYDADARVIAGLHMAEDRFFLVDMETDTYDWLTYAHDDLLVEEIRLSKFQRMNDYLEAWLSLDRPEDRQESGRPNGISRWPINIEHVKIDADISQRTRRGSYGLSKAAMINASFTAELHFTPTRAGLGALPLHLTSTAHVTSVFDDQGNELPFIREPIGENNSGIDDRLHDSSLVVLLPEPLTQGEPSKLLISYDREVVSFVSGRRWYPGLFLAFEDVHTAELRITAGKKTQVRAIGELTDKLASETADGRDVMTWVWLMNEPTKMAGFSFADRFVEATIEQEGIPKVVAFSPPVSSLAKKRVRNVGADIANSLRFFQWLFDSRLPVDTMLATGIPSGHGQAFEGFLHLSEFTFRGESTNGAELFRAHEVAHQWWGHELGWQTYRDQWLSEAFAEYSSMMFLESTVDGGKKAFSDVLRAYTDLLTGKRIANINRFVRPGLSDIDHDHLARLGPIGLGWRASTCQMPQGYLVQSYYKGPMVLHMLRQLVKTPQGSDDLFIKILRDFVATHRGGSPSTTDFQQVVEKNTGADWSWFFDQWIYSTDIPKYKWSYEAQQVDGQHVLELTVRQEDVSEGFMMSIPVRVEFADGKGGTVRVMVKQEQETFRFPLPKKPKKVIFNPNFAVLAKVSKG